MTHKGLRGLVGGAALSVGVALGCGGTAELKTSQTGGGGSGIKPLNDGHDENQGGTKGGAGPAIGSTNGGTALGLGGTSAHGGTGQQSDAGSGGTGQGGSPYDYGCSAGRPAFGGTGAAGCPTTAGSGGLDSDGYTWNLSCVNTVEEYCAQPGNRCVRDWNEAQLPSGWCGGGAFLSLFIHPACNGYNAITVLENDVRHYYYDLQTSQLVHVDVESPEISRFECVAGDFVAQLDVFGCGRRVRTCE